MRFEPEFAISLLLLLLPCRIITLFIVFAFCFSFEILYILHVFCLSFMLTLVSFNFRFGYATFLPLLFYRIPLSSVQIRLGWPLFGIPSPSVCGFFLCNKNVGNFSFVQKMPATSLKRQSNFFIVDSPIK